MEARSTLCIGWVEITEPLSGLYFLPYATGLLQAYVAANAPDPSRYHFLLPQFLRLPLPEAVASFGEADVVGFSIYSWNVNYSLRLAQALKKHKPELLIVMGGPQVPDDPALFLSNLPFVDLVCHGEGEATFLQIVEALPQRKWEGIPGISYLDAQGSCQTHPRAPRMKSLADLPSPFLNGVFEPLLARHPGRQWATAWESNRGCPFSCTFCDWGSNINSKVVKFEIERLEQEIAWLGQHKIDFIYCTDANFGIFPRDIALSHTFVKSHQRFGFPRRIVTQMTKNQPDRAFESHKILRDAGMLVAAALSLQSVTPAVLKTIKRENISLQAFEEVLKRLLAHDIPTYTDILLGLPEESFESFLQGFDTLIEQGQLHELRVWNVHVLPNSEMAQPDYRQHYGIQTAIVPYHAPDDDASERQTGIREEAEMVVATRTMPHPDWLRSQALVWLVQMLYNHRLLQLPFLIISAVSGLPHREILRAFLEGPLPEGAELWAYMREFLLQKAEDYANGQGQFCRWQDAQSGSEQWVSPAAFLIGQLYKYEQVGPFYQESGQILQALLNNTPQLQPLPEGLFEEAMLLCRHMFEGKPDPLPMRFNLREAYAQLRKGQPMIIKQQGTAIYSGK